MRRSGSRSRSAFNAFLYVDEGDAFFAVMDRKGATIGETIRRAWSGSTLGQATADSDRTRVVASGMYALEMMLGFQYAKAGRLFDDKAGRMPQRFLHADARDPNLPTVRTPWPGH